MKKQEQKHTSLPWFGIPRIIPYLKAYRWYYPAMILTALGGTLADIAIPLFQQYALNHFIGLGVLDTLGIFVALYVGVLIFQIVVNFTSTYIGSCIETWVNRDLRQTAFNHLQTLSFSYFNQNSVGYLHARVMSDTSRIGEMVSWILLDCLWNVSYLIGAVVVMLSLNWRLALPVIAIVPLTVALIALFQNRLTRLNRRIRELNSNITANFNEGITGAKTVKTLVVEDKIERDFRKVTAEMKRTSVWATHYRALFGATITFASSLALALVLRQGGRLTLETAFEIGTLSVFMSYALGMMEPIRWVVNAVSNLISVQVNIERLTNLISTESDVADSPEVVEKYGDTFSPKTENWEKLEGDIAFEDVTFRYPDGDVDILEHFDLTIPRGSSIAIVGETGAGKSTLVNLVCRFFEPTAGRVLIDGRDARERSQLWLHRSIGYVLQTPHLFSGTVRENLRYGKPDATDEEIMEALKRVSADAVVARMDKGLDSEVGEGGSLLSTGEKQLLSFARALLADPRILILDEATASVDTLTEQKIQHAIEEIIEGRTALMIAHRLSTIRHTDLILVVDAGRIVERGTHEELLAARGAYYKLYTRQYEEEEANKLLG
ncbi:MAG: ABC transporter ATP-binding protein [Clostridia bacterium]|nr:ABC transporter ATP-binding protein [Clostridia bacterium]